MKKIILLILDGFGIRESENGNAVKMASLPNLTKIFTDYSISEIETSAEFVGLPNGVTGNCEVGHPQFTDLVMNHELGDTEARRIYTGATTIVPASYQIWTKRYDPRSAEVVNATLTFCSNNDAAAYRVPTLTYGDDVKKERTDLYNAIKSYVDEMALKFVTGEVSLDKYPEYEEQLKKLGVDRLFEIMTEAYQEWARNGGIID